MTLCILNTGKVKSSVCAIGWGKLISNTGNSTWWLHLLWFPFPAIGRNKDPVANCVCVIKNCILTHWVHPWWHFLHLPCWKNGKPAALDVTVISPLQKLTIQEASTTQGHMLVAHRRKWASHQNTCQAAEINIVQLVVEDGGRRDQHWAATWRMEPSGSGNYQIDCSFSKAEAGIVHLINNCTPSPAACHSTVEGERLHVG